MGVECLAAWRIRLYTQKGFSGSVLLSVRNSRREGPTRFHVEESHVVAKHTGSTLLTLR